MKIKLKNIDINIFFIFFLFYILILIGFFFNEDSLGGAKSDFNHYYKISLSFAENFLTTFREFDTEEAKIVTRNSPIFWIILSQVSKFISYDFLRIINSVVSIFICYYFFKCLKLRYKKIKDYILILISCSVFLSPTIRSLSIWPYPLIWGLLFFVISIFHFLKFLESKQNEEKFKQSLITIFFVVISAYIHPAFGIFFIFYFINFYYFFNFNKKILLLLIFSLILSVPFLFYIYSKDIFTTFESAQGISMDDFNSFNISNKILIISAMTFFFIAPVLNFKLIKEELNNLKAIEMVSIITFCLINIYFFNYPKYDSGFGGGFFYKLSNILFQNNYLFYLFSSFSILYIYTIRKLIKKKINNSIVFLSLILFTPQLTIYHKYYDPLILIIFMTLINFDFKKHYFDKKNNTLQLYFFGISYLLIGLFKSQVY
ncbi:hypothetical protein OA523_01645 [Candidatus Pelagibacter sp.]|nr:hypothetical protein [Candidatus Pelagibacter sp.]